MNVVAFAAVGLATVSLGTSSSAVESVKYDHFSVNADSSCTVGLSNGQALEVVIVNTTSEFELRYKGIKKSTGTKSKGQPESVYTIGPKEISRLEQLLKTAGLTLFAPETTKVVIGHSDEFGGYILDLRRKDPSLPAFRLEESDSLEDYLKKANELPGDREGARDLLDKYGEFKELQSVTLVVQVTSPPSWQAEFAGGFTMSWLTDEEYAVVERDSTMTLFHDEEAEDQVSPGVAAFIHVTPPWLKQHASISLGLGIDEEKNASLFPGLSWRFGGIGFLTAGAHVGSIVTRPAGVFETDDTVDPNILNTLGKKTEADFFLALSYSFLSTAEKTFQKPFAEPGAADKP